VQPAGHKPRRKGAILEIPSNRIDGDAAETGQRVREGADLEKNTVEHRRSGRIAARRVPSPRPNGSRPDEREGGARLEADGLTSPEVDFRLIDDVGPADGSGRAAERFDGFLEQRELGAGGPCRTGVSHHSSSDSARGSRNRKQAPVE